MEEYPKLIESGVKNYISGALQSCHQNRINIYYYALNIGVLAIFLGIVAVTLYCCYKRKPSIYETKQKMLRDQEYVLSKIRYYQSEQKNLMTSPIGQI